MKEFRYEDECAERETQEHDGRGPRPRRSPFLPGESKLPVVSPRPTRLGWLQRLSTRACPTAHSWRFNVVGRLARADVFDST